MHELPHLSEIAWLHEERGAGPLEEFALPLTQDVTGQEDHALTQYRKSPRARSA